jgi:hypothetical protein
MIQDASNDKSKTMNLISALKLERRGKFGLALGAFTLGSLICLASILCTSGQDTNAPVAKNVQTKAESAPPAKKTPKKKLTGAELYAINCNRCHAERYPTEFTSAQWKTIMIHMRVRANLPAAQAREILKYLQEDSGN